MRKIPVKERPYLTATHAVTTIEPERSTTAKDDEIRPDPAAITLKEQVQKIVTKDRDLYEKVRDIEYPLSPTDGHS